MRSYDLEFLRKAITLASSAVAHGNSPFGAVLVDANGQFLLEAENSVAASRDSTAHAETNLVRTAYQAYPHEVLAGCTLYASTEPCAMCAAAIFWAGIGRVVFALSEHEMVAQVGPALAADFLDLPCREVFARGGHPVEVLGPLLQEEARQAHIGFWEKLTEVK